MTPGHPSEHPERQADIREEDRITDRQVYSIHADKLADRQVYRLEDRLTDRQLDRKTGNLEKLYIVVSKTFLQKFK